MNNTVDIAFLRFLSRKQYDIRLDDALSIMDEVHRLYLAPGQTPDSEGAVWRGLYFSPEADEALRSPNGGLITAIKHLRADNPQGVLPNTEGYRFTPDGLLGLKDAKDVCEARRSFLRG